MIRARGSSGKEVALALLLAVLVPGMRYFFPTGTLFWSKAFFLASCLWLARAFLQGFLANRGGRVWKAFDRLLAPATLLLLLHPVVFFGVLLVVFFRWTAILLALLGAACLGISLFRSRGVPSARGLMVSGVVLILTAMAACLWNFNLVGSRGFNPSASPPEVRAVLSVAELVSGPDEIGEAHPYALAYDADSDTLITSFKDDWGAVFPRSGRRRHNFLAACSTLAADKEARFLFFGPGEIPENLALDPAHGRGWVNVLNVRERTFHVAAFRYDRGGLALTGSGPLPVEPNAVFYDRKLDRVLVVGINLQILELDPTGLSVLSRVDLTPRLEKIGQETNPLNGFYHELSILVCRYRAESRILFLGTMGSYFHSLTIRDLAHRKAPAFPMVIGADVGDDGLVLAAQPLQRRVLVVEADTLAIRGRLDAGVPVRPVAGIPGTRLVVAGAYTENRTVVLDRDSGMVVAELALGRLQRDAVPDPARKRVFIATGLGVFEIDGGRLLDAAAAGRLPRASGEPLELGGGVPP